MNFLCPGCKRRITKEERIQKPKMIAEAGIHDMGYHMGWMECEQQDACLPVQERSWYYSDRVPVIGEERILKIEVPFDEEKGETFTTLFEPWNLYLNGWSEAECAEETGKACVVLCRFDVVLWADDFYALITVMVLNAIPHDQLPARIPVTVAEDRLVDEFPAVYRTFGSVCTEYEDERWLYRTWADFGGYAWKMQLIYTDDQGIRHEVMTSWSEGHDHHDYFYFGNTVNQQLRIIPLS